MEGLNLEGFIYDYSLFRIIYCSLIGKVYINERTEIINKGRKPSVGMWCKFKASREENGEWFAQKILLMAYPRLKYVAGENECIVKGIAVICNINANFGYLWNDYIGLIAIEKQMIYQLKPLTAVEFQAVPLQKSGTSAYFTAKEINAESENIFQSEVLIFMQNAEIKPDGRAHVSAYSTPPTIGSSMSILYYKAYNDSTSGTGIYATTDSDVVAGIRDGFFTTKRYFETDAEHIEVEQFTDAHKDSNMTCDQSPVLNNEVFDVEINLFESPTGSIVEFQKNDENNDSSKIVNPLDDNSSCSMDQNFESCSSLNSVILHDELDPDDKFSSTSFAKEEMVNKTVVICKTDSELARPSKDFPTESEKEFMKLDEDRNAPEHNDINGLIHQSQNNKETSKEGIHGEETSKEGFHGELKDHSEERHASVRHMQSVKTMGMKGDVNSIPTPSIVSQTTSRTSANPDENIFTEKASDKWIVEVDKLCIKVLSNPRLRNFVSVNENGNALLRDIMYYLEYQMTVEEVSEELGIPLWEVTPECFDIAHEERALRICREFMKMSGFERIAGSKIPKIPEQTN
ncbi:Dual specificity calcium/calmodulin-dependent 3',5'-cyclic nucleotide phosphodiesterase 1C [Dirofilaria immitis]